MINIKIVKIKFYESDNLYIIKTQYIYILVINTEGDQLYFMDLLKIIETDEVAFRTAGQ